MQRPRRAQTTIPRRPIKLGLVRSFVAVARRLSFSLAAEELFLTQSAVSRQIRAFENEVGVPLFERHTRSVELTAAGQQLLRIAGASVDGMDHAIATIRSQGKRATLSINTWASFASMWLLPKLESFKTENPDVDIQIHTTDTFVGAEETAFDFVIRWTAPGSVPDNAIRLFGERLTPVASPTLLGRRKRLRFARDVLAFTLIDSGAPGNAVKTRWVTWRTWLERNGLHHQEPRSWLQLSLADQGILAAQKGQGIALARLPLVLDAIHKGELVEVLPDNQTVLPQAYWLIVSRMDDNAAAQQRFLEWLLEQALLTRLSIGEEP